jgi:uncharacterized 2Fe-2S/4Fe-4S cluster protein (DUF4445 family)
MMKNQKHSVVFQPSGLRGKVNDDTLLDAAQQFGVELESVCGGNGVCGKCKVKVEDGYFAKYGITSSAGAVETKEELSLKFLSTR